MEGNKWKLPIEQRPNLEISGKKTQTKTEKLFYNLHNQQVWSQ